MWGFIKTAQLIADIKPKAHQPRLYQSYVLTQPMRGLGADFRHSMAAGFWLIGMDSISFALSSTIKS
ncbi:hypothetical protein LPIBR_70016 [Lacticaseibacillus paracasei]|nr:hypothetical protein LPIBR_70016 [Lacticaseibacillus paracasei]